MGKVIIIMIIIAIEWFRKIRLSYLMLPGYFTRGYQDPSFKKRGLTYNIEINPDKLLR